MPQCTKQVNWKKFSSVQSRQSLYTPQQCAAPHTVLRNSLPCWPRVKSSVESRLFDHINSICKDHIYFTISKHCVLKNYWRAFPSLTFLLLLLNYLVLKLWQRLSKVDVHVGDGPVWDVRAWAGSENPHAEGWPGNMMSNLSGWGRRPLGGSSLAWGARTQVGWQGRLGLGCWNTRGVKRVPRWGTCPTSRTP